MDDERPTIVTTAPVELLLPAVREPGELVHVTMLKRALTFDRELLEVPEGLTIAEMLRCAGIPAGTPTRVWVEQVFIPPAMYRHVRPKRGKRVVVRVVPRGGTADSKNIGMLALGIVLIVIGAIMMAPPATPGGAFVLGLGVSLVLSAAINMLVPPPVVPKLRPLSGVGAAEQESPTLAIEGGRNALKRYGVVPRVLGTHRMFPPPEPGA